LKSIVGVLHSTYIIIGSDKPRLKASDQRLHADHPSILLGGRKGVPRMYAYRVESRAIEENAPSP
jgi:hypothetical protein